jgi:hypothetical protein
MTQTLLLSPRYRLDDGSTWLEGIDPSRQYWIAVNGNPAIAIAIPGLLVSTVSELKAAILAFRDLQPQETMVVKRIVGGCTIRCIGANCYAIEGEVQGAPVWHLFDLESLESLLMTSHPHWLPSAKDIELGRKQLALAFEQPAYV